MSRRRDPRHEVPEREREQRVGERDGRRDPDRPPGDPQVGRIGEREDLRKLSSVQWWTSLPVNESTVQNDETSRTASAPR